MSCGAYFQSRSANETLEVLERFQLQAALDPSPCSGFEGVLEFAPDVFRIVATELTLGNEADHVCTTENGMVVLVLRYRFLDGHIHSSWVECEKSPEHHHWHAWYRCDVARCAVPGKKFAYGELEVRA